MSAISEPIKAMLRRSLGPDRGESAIAAVVEAKSRLQYGLSAAGRRSARELASLRNRHAGERCVIIGNGPSLKETDLALVKGEITFGLNRGYLLFRTFGFATTYLAAISTHVVEQFAHEILAEPSTTFVSWQARRFLAPTHRAVLMRPLRGPRFSTDATHGIWGGGTVTFAAMQLAYHMGFSEVVLIGVDHSFSTVGPAHEVVTSTGDDPDHFDPAYFGKGVRWELPDLPLSEVRMNWHAAPLRPMDERSDATVRGKLTIFPKTDLRTALGHAGGVPAGSRRRRLPSSQTRRGRSLLTAGGSRLAGGGTARQGWLQAAHTALPHPAYRSLTRWVSAAAMSRSRVVFASAETWPPRWFARA
jgi:hypothetical protein